MLDRNYFEARILDLENHYGKKLTDFARETYYQRLSALSEGQMMESAALCVCKFPSRGGYFFPSPDQMLEVVGCCERPAENWQAYEQRKALPSEEMRMSLEQRMRNIQRMREITKNLGTKPQVTPIHNKSAEDYRKIAERYKKRWSN